MPLNLIYVWLKELVLKQALTIVQIIGFFTGRFNFRTSISFPQQISWSHNSTLWCLLQISSLPTSIALWPMDAFV